MRPEVDELFHRIADLSTEERATYLAKDPRGAETVREVEELLAYDSTGSDLLTSSIAAAASQAIRALDAVGARCGAFRLEKVIGRGGMGVVYFAERMDGEVHQQAAVKLLQPGWTDAQRERFLQEREILAGLSHPNVAHLLDAGHLEDGQPYLAMEYVGGEPMDRYCEGLGERQKIELFLKVCAAVEYLHRNQLVHRDLKPGNILVTSEGEPKLVDFGISKILDEAGDATATCARMLTPNYASPEQVSGGAVGTASDIYSLGIVLREIIGGELKGDLEGVVRAATRPEPEARYASVEQFAEDLQAVLEQKGTRARRWEWLYRAKKVGTRRPLAVMAGALAVSMALTAGAAVWFRSRPATSATLSAKRLTANTPELPIQSAAISPDGQSIAYSDTLGIHVRDTATGDSRLLPKTAGHVITQWMPDGAGLVATIQEGTTLKAVTVGLTGAAPEPASEPWVYSRYGKRRMVSPTGVQRVIAENADGTDSREIWRVTAGRTLNDFAWSPNEEEIAVISAGEIGSTLEVVNVESRRRTVLVADASKLSIGGVVWAEARRIVFSTFERTGVNSYNSNLWEARLNARWELAARGLRQLTAWSDFPIQPGSLSTDGKRLVFVRSFAQRDVYVARMDAGRRHMETPRRLTLELGDDYPTGWTQDGRSVILTSDRGGESKIFRQDVGRQTAEPVVEWAGKQAVGRLAPGGQSVLFCSMVPKERMCRLMRAPLGGGSPELVDTIQDFGDLRCSAAGRCAVTEMGGPRPGHVISELDPVKGKGREIYRDSDRRSGTADVSPDGKWVANLSGTKILVRSFATGAMAREIQVSGARMLATLYYAPDGKGFYAGEYLPTEARQLYVDLSGKATVLWRQPGRAINWGVPSPDGKMLALMMLTTDANVYMVDGI